MNPQTQGLEDLAGTYPFDLRVSHRALKLNRFFWNLVRAFMIAAPGRDRGAVVPRSYLARWGDGASKAKVAPAAP